MDALNLQNGISHMNQPSLAQCERSEQELECKRIRTVYSLFVNPKTNEHISIVPKKGKEFLDLNPIEYNSSLVKTKETTIRKVSLCYIEALFRCLCNKLDFSVIELNTSKEKKK